MIHNQFIGGSLIVAGTCIGAGMLALPIATASTGFLFSVMILACAWFFMYVAGLYVLEVNLSLPEGNSYVSMARKSLGQSAAIVTWLLFILLLYSLLAAYVTSGGELTEQMLETVTGIAVPKLVGPLFWSVVFAGLFYWGMKPADYLNRCFMIGLVLSYGCVIYLGMSHIEIKHYQIGKVSKMMMALPIVFTSFGYQIVVPSMREYLQSDAVKIRQVILYGSLLPLVVYCLWEAVIFGTIPFTGEQSLQAILQSGKTTRSLIDVLQITYGSHLVSFVIRSFIFFAIASSFLGVSLGLYDMVADSLAISKTGCSRFALILITFLPPILYAECYPNQFILALNYAGLFVAILHGILPVLMALAIRQQVESVKPVYQVPGGYLLMAVTLLFFIFVIIFDISVMVGWLS